MTYEWYNSQTTERLGMNIEGGGRFKFGRRKGEGKCYRDENMVVRMMKIKLAEARLAERKLRKELRMMTGQESWRSQKRRT